MRVGVITAVYNEEKSIGNLIESLLKQTRLPDEIILVDDGSTDKTAEIIREYAEKHPCIRYLHQENKGPAAARNRAWKSTGADTCVFTDGDCVPELKWMENLLRPFEREDVGAAAGTYKTLNPENVLARFIGLEIAWRYRKVRGEVDVHGSYNLAVRRKILEELGGFKETYRFPSGEDWDLTYRISRRYKIIYVPEAVVGHYHPEDFIGYMKNQMRRAFDRVRLYRDHPEKVRRDSYTGRVVKYQVLGTGALIPSLVLFHPLFSYGYLIPCGIFLFLAATAFIPFSYFVQRDVFVAFYSLGVQFCRYFAWLAGALAGFLRR